MALSTIQNNSFADTAVHGRRNLIINGAMQVAQRSTSSTSTTGYNSVDRMLANNINTNTTVTHSQQQDGPNGFQYCFEVKNTTDGTPASNAYLELQTRLEANDARILNQSDEFTLSFYYKSNITATLPVQIYHRTDANSVWNMWKGVSVIGDGEWYRAELTFTKNTAVAADPKTGTDWGFIVAMNFELGTSYVDTTNENVWRNNGSVTGPNFGLCGSLNDYIRITGMQVEVGSQATPFEHRSYGEELYSCERYFQVWAANGNNNYITTGRNHTSTQSIHSLAYKTTMRANPTLATNGIAIFDGSTRVVSSTSINGSSPHACGINLFSTGMTANLPAQTYFSDTSNGYIRLDAEL